jgi:hypothetical protein
MEICPCCKGGKVQHLTGVEVTVKGTQEMPPVDISCVWCNGTGEVGPEVIREHRFYSTMWCKCGNPSGKTVFFNDGEHTEISKHHYRCYDCKKVTQIG